MKQYLLSFLTAFLLLTHSSQAQVVTTYAGTPSTPGYAGNEGPATDAILASPSDVAVDSKGNLYIADFLNNVIRKVDTFGIITTFAGTGTGAGGMATGAFSGDNGPATAADFNGPFALAIDKNGNMIIADGYNHVVRKINPAGIVTTIAGNHSVAGYTGDGGPATAATLNNPVGVAVDTLGNIYIADDHNNAVRKINALGIISTFAGDTAAGYSGNGGPATLAKLNLPLGVAVDRNGNVYIADAMNNMVRKVDTFGIINDYVGSVDTAHGYSGDEGPAINAKLYYPTRLVFDASGNLFISDALNNVIRKVSATGFITTYAGTGVSGFYGDGLPPDSAQFAVTYGVAFNQYGHMFIVDRGNEIIRRVGPPIPSQVPGLHAAIPGLNIYPNPAINGRFVVDLISGSNEQGQLTISNVLGATVQQLAINTNQPVSVNASLAPGVYFVSATTPRGSWRKQLVVR